MTVSNALTAMALLATAAVIAGDAELPWGDAVNGLASRLALTTPNPALGQAIHVRLEVRNVGAQPAQFDSQQSAVNNPLLVIGPDGREAPNIGGSFQTTGGATTLPPGQTRTIVEKLNVVDQYLIERPGRYTIQTRSRGGVPASNVLTVTVQPGQLTDFQKLLVGLHAAAPKGWRVTRYGDSIVFLHTPTRLKADAASISLDFYKEPVGGPKPIRGAPMPILLGETSLGQAWLSAESQTAVDRWPDYAKVIGAEVTKFQKPK